MRQPDENYKIKPKWIWIAAAVLFVVSLPVIWLYESFGRQTEGVFGCAAVSVMIIYALQYPLYIRRFWYYVYMVVLGILYLTVALLLPNEIPTNMPTSVFLWPFVLFTVGIDWLVMRLFLLLFER